MKTSKFKLTVNYLVMAIIFCTSGIMAGEFFKKLKLLVEIQPAGIGMSFFYNIIL